LQSGNLKLLEPYGQGHACNGIALPLALPCIFLGIKLSSNQVHVLKLAEVNVTRLQIM
jgi:hypothetical protein